MEKENKILIMLIGKTHSGKTTFAKKIKNEVRDILILEADPITIFIKEHFPELKDNDDQKHSELFKEVSLRYRTFLLFLEFALSLGRPIILSNSNMYINGRTMIFDLCKKFNYKVIGVHLDLSEEILFNRTQDSNRSLNVLRTSKDFNDLIINQRNRMQPPESSEFDEFFNIKLEGEIVEVENKLKKLLL